MQIDIGEVVIDAVQSGGGRQASQETEAKRGKRKSFRTVGFCRESREHSSGRLKVKDSGLTFRRCGGFLRDVIDVMNEYREEFNRAAFYRSITILSNIPIVRGLVLQEWAQFSNGRVEKNAFLGSKLNYWVVLAALTFGNESLNLEEELRRRSKLHFRGGNRASFAKHDFLPYENA
ncbi:hypothetical protein ALC62_04361 [Cyphomyrmex costatus]|uniref:Uncharacterized protein n=1 Tax=Cyphomyrmex costatus TaxID=456900 RepID=A0A195CVM3_9HYME|nr:hypothetical protein ALC62_04361 [Cyphomyrmex costatus]